MESDKWEQKHLVFDTYYVNNNYGDVTKVHEDYVEFRTGRKQKKNFERKKNGSPKE